MKSIEALLQSLQADDPRERNVAALELDRGDARAVPALLTAIAQPENLHHRGTLVHALSAFNPQPHLEVLVTLALTGNFEVSTAAFSILEDATLTPASAARIQAQMARHPVADLREEHQVAAASALQDLFGPT